MKPVAIVSLIALAISGCESVKPVEVVAVKSEVLRPPMSSTCHTKDLEKFKPVQKAKEKDQTPNDALAHALQSNKSRMAKNEERVLKCECAQAFENKNKDDLARLGAACDKHKPVEAKPEVAKGHPAPATETAQPAAPPTKAPAKKPVPKNPEAPPQQG